MKTELIDPVVLTEADVSAIAKLMLNAWSAEYALRITPVVNDESYLQSSLHWTFPQAYYSALYGLRAVLVTLGHASTHQNTLLAASVVLHKYRLYEETNLKANFLGDLQTLCHLSAQTIAGDPVAYQTRLLGIVEQVAIAHEAHLLDCLGREIYTRLIDALPAYLRDSFLGDRLAYLLAEEQTINWLKEVLAQ